MEHFLNIDFIIKNKKIIHYFGLGFIQVKLNDFERIHFYTNELEKTCDVEEIHNHRYNFTSTILKGSLKQEIYEIDRNTDNAKYVLTQESCDPNNKVYSSPIKVNINKVYEKTYITNDSYYIDHNTFHTVDSSDAITYLKRSKYMKPLADVIFNSNNELICPFSHNVEESKLLEIIRIKCK